MLPERQLQRTQSNIEIQRYAEDEGDEDFSDVFGPGDDITEKDESDKGSEAGGLMVLSKLSNNSWLGDEEDEEDPFAFMDPGWDEMDLDANIARDRHARLAEKVEELVRSIKMIEGEDRLSELSEDLVCSPNSVHASVFKMTDMATVGTTMGEPGGERPHRRRPWSSPTTGVVGTVYSQESSTYDLATIEGCKHGKPTLGPSHLPYAHLDRSYWTMSSCRKIYALSAVFLSSQSLRRGNIQTRFDWRQPPLCARCTRRLR